MQTFSRLVCGGLADGSEAAGILAHINSSLDKFSDRAVGYLGTAENPDLILFGPFSARVLMENSAAALVGRTDPFRIVYLGRFQAQSHYDPAKRSKSSFAWQGDVLSSEKDRAELWADDLDTSKVSRALFSQHLDDMFWKPAVDAALDAAAYNTGLPHVSTFLESESDTFIAGAKGRGASIYSQLSKGVHWEFFSSAAATFDEATVKQIVRDALTWCCRLGLVSHFLPNAQGCIAGEEALQSYSDCMVAIHGA